MRKVSISGILISIVAHFLSDMLLGLLFFAALIAYTVFSDIVLHASHAQTHAEMRAALHGNSPLFITLQLIGLATTAFGGYLAARIAKHTELLNAGLSSVPWVVYRIYTIAAGKNSMSLWLQIFLLLAAPAFAIAGGELMRRQREVRHRLP